MYNGDESEFYQQWKDIKRPIAYQWCRPSWQLSRQYDVVVAVCGGSAIPDELPCWAELA